MIFEEVLTKHGMNLQQVAKAIGMRPSTLQETIERNPTVKSLRRIAEAVNCPIAEFFADELAAAGLCIAPMTDEDKRAAQLQAPAGADDLPFDGDSEPKAEEVKAVRFTYDCPHCGNKVRVTIDNG